MVALGYVYTLIGETNFAFPRMLYESECHQGDVHEGALARELIGLEGRSNVPRQQVIGL